MPTKLKPNATPTLFDVPNPPKRIDVAGRPCAVKRATAFQNEEKGTADEHNYAAKRQKQCS